LSEAQIADFRRRVSAALTRVKHTTRGHEPRFYRLGEIREWSYENQRYLASGLNRLVAAIRLAAAA
jgi:hypothetical protein